MPADENHTSGLCYAQEGGSVRAVMGTTCCSVASETVTVICREDRDAAVDMFHRGTFLAAPYPERVLERLGNGIPRGDDTRCLIGAERLRLDGRRTGTSRCSLLVPRRQSPDLRGDLAAALRRRRDLHIADLHLPCADVAPDRSNHRFVRPRMKFDACGCLAV